MAKNLATLFCITLSFMRRASISMMVAAVLLSLQLLCCPSWALLESSSSSSSSDSDSGNSNNSDSSNAPRLDVPKFLASIPDAGDFSLKLVVGKRETLAQIDMRSAF